MYSDAMSSLQRYSRMTHNRKYKAHISDLRYSAAELMELHLKSSVEGSLYGDALGVVCTARRYSGYQAVQLILFVFEFFNEALDSSLGKRLALSTLPMTHQIVNNGQASVG